MLLNDNPQFVPFMGTVEDIENDPKHLGRVKVRVFNHHEDLTVEDLDWFSVGVPASSASKQGVGQAPVGLAIGSVVYGFYFDGVNRAMPVILGTIPTIPGNDVSKHGVSKYARGTPQDITSDAPNIAGAPKYPFNQVIETSAGHVIEIDNTPQNERIVIKHKSGSFAAINKDGDIALQSAKDSYHLVSGDFTETIKGAVKSKAKTIDLTTDGKFSINAKGDCNITSTGKITLKATNVEIE